MKRAYKFLIVFLSVAGLGVTAMGIVEALRSPLFTVKVVEVTDVRDQESSNDQTQLDRASAPSLSLDSQEVVRLAGIPTGTVNLFDLDLAPVEKRLLANPWIRAVKLQKRFPETVSIAIEYREPVAVLQSSGGALSYLDANGETFGKIDTSQELDLPLFSGFEKQPLARLKEGIQLVLDWQNHEIQRAAQISSVHWDGERGFRVQAIYPMGVAPATAAGASSTTPQNPARVSRVTVQFGQTLYGTTATTLPQLVKVIRYLSEHNIASRQILADAGKKIVVKTARGS